MIRRRETLVLLALAGVVGLGAVGGVVIDRLAGKDDRAGAVTVPPLMRGRVIPWIRAAPPEPAEGIPRAAADLPTIVAEISTPSTAVAGGSLRYGVTLRNNGPHPVKLDPCPAYEESLSSADGEVRVPERFFVNCDAIGILNSEEEVFLAVVFNVPPWFPAGPANLLWAMEGGASTFASLVVVSS